MLAHATHLRRPPSHDGAVWHLLHTPCHATHYTTPNVTLMRTVCTVRCVLIVPCDFPKRAWRPSLIISGCLAAPSRGLGALGECGALEEPGVVLLVRPARPVPELGERSVAPLVVRVVVPARGSRVYACAVVREGTGAARGSPPGSRSRPAVGEGRAGCLGAHTGRAPG